MSLFDPDIEEILSQAEALLQDKRPIEALSLLDRAGKLAPRHAWATLYRGVALGQLDKVDEAVELLLSAADQHADDLDIQIDAAWHLALLDFPQDALVTIERALTLDKHDAGAIAVYAEILERLNRIEEAVRVREDLLLHHPEDEENRLLLAMDLCDCGRYADALNLANPLIKTNPQDADIVRLQGACLSYQGNHEAAAELWEKLEALEGQTQNLLHNRACTLDALLQHEEALYTINLAIAREPDEAINYFTRGMINEHLEKQDKAVDDYLKALQYDHDFIDTVVNLAEVAQWCGRVPYALECVDEMLIDKGEDEPPCAVLLYARGLLLLQINEIADARVAIEAAVQREPEIGIAWHTLSIVYQMEANDEGVIIATERALRSFPDDSELLMYRGIAFAGRELFAEALDCFDQLLTLTPDDANPYMQMAQIFLYHLHRYADARAMLRETLRIIPKHRDAYAELILCHLRLGELDVAGKLIKGMHSSVKGQYWDCFLNAALCAQRGKINAAFGHLFRTPAADYQVPAMLMDPLFQPLAHDERFAEWSDDIV